MPAPLDGAVLRRAAGNRLRLQFPDARRLRGRRAPWTVENFVRLADPLYLAIFWRSLWIASRGDGALHFAWVSHWPSSLRAPGSFRNLYLQLVLLPFWTSFLVRTYAWLFILRDTGLLNTALQRLHVIGAPLPLLYNDGAVLLGLVYIFCPSLSCPCMPRWNVWIRH